MNFVFKKESPDVFWQLWGECADLHQAGPRYLQRDLEYMMAVMSERNDKLEDLSFVAVKENKVVAAAFLPVEERSGVRSVSVEGGYYTPAPLADPIVEKEIFAKIDELAREHKIDKIQFAADPVSSAKYNFLQKYGYLDTPILTYIIEVANASVEMELKKYRKGHRCDIKNLLGDKNVSVEIADKDNPSRALHEQYCELHHKAAGRETRPKETFDMQYDMVANGSAALFCVKYKENVVACAYFTFAHGSARYCSSAADPNPQYEILPFGHLALHEARMYFGKRGISEINTELPSSPAPQFHYYPDKKWLSIALFKRGFPGHFAQEFRGVKYYNRGLFEKETEEFRKHYIETI